ncbi:MAG TPA: hypothetical protein VFR80_13200 [Pyrinomonadaceae bacterium]|nr:hypothetical protein [Pyrinomonadaceae bacterium]
MSSRIPARIYGFLLMAYPAQFRREYGPHMTQVFRDCYREQRRLGSRFALLRLWCRTLIDLMQSAPTEHIDNFGKENFIMNNLRRDAVAVLGCLAIIVIAVFTWEYGRGYQLFSLLLIGFMLDAIILTGIVGNFIVFVLAKVTKLNTLRTALWTFLTINSLWVIVSVLIGVMVDPQFNLLGVTIGYVVSFLFWYGLHWIWAQWKRSEVAV